MIGELQKAHRGLNRGRPGDINLRDRVISACRDVGECKLALWKPAITYEGLCADIRNALTMEIAPNVTLMTEPDETLYTNRRFFNNRQSSSQGRYQKRGNVGSNQRGSGKICFVCKKPGCWSTNHSKEERQKSTDDFKRRLRNRNFANRDREVAQYIIEMEGEEGTDEWDVLIADIGELKLKDDDSNNSTPEPYEQDFMFTTHFGSFNGYEAVDFRRFFETCCG
jgi:hypothetical protein